MPSEPPVPGLRTFLPADDAAARRVDPALLGGDEAALASNDEPRTLDFPTTAFGLTATLFRHEPGGAANEKRRHPEPAAPPGPLRADVGDHLSVRELARRLRLSAHTIRRLAREGKFPKSVVIGEQQHRWALPMSRRTSPSGGGRRRRRQRGAGRDGRGSDPCRRGVPRPPARPRPGTRPRHRRPRRFRRPPAPTRAARPRTARSRPGRRAAAPRAKRVQTGRERLPGAGAPPNEGRPGAGARLTPRAGTATRSPPAGRAGTRTPSARR